MICACNADEVRFGRIRNQHAASVRSPETPLARRELTAVSSSRDIPTAAKRIGETTRLRSRLFRGVFDFARNGGCGLR